METTQDPLWYKNAILYQVHVKSFFDTTRDGFGDFRGLHEKLDYIAGLGVTAVWLLPFCPSPLRDDGYDIADYYGVHPTYGSLSDCIEFIEAAHEHGLKVIGELVINHTSDQHHWFQRARISPPGSPERDYYVWSDTPDRYRDARIIFTDTEPSNWTWDDVAQAYYWHRFFHHQPDLNFDNPLVRAEIIKVMRFWLDQGLDGLRLDAVPYLIEREGTNCENLPETHAYLRELRAVVDEFYPGRMLLAEANQWPQDVRAYFGDGDECHMAFHFPLMPRLFMSLRREDTRPIRDILLHTPTIPDTCEWATFLRNHDELTLEMVTDEERDYMYNEYAADPQMRLNVGIRRRLAPLLNNNRRAVELLTSLLLSLPGTPVIYYGDEIGMGDNIYLGDRNGVRTPMQWNGDRNAGFSRADAARLYSPLIVDPVYGYQSINVEAQERDQSSLLNWMKRTIAVRRRHSAFNVGMLQLLESANHSVLAFVRRGTTETMLVVANLSRFVQPAQISLSAFAGLSPVEVIGGAQFPLIGMEPYFLSLGPHSFYWFQLKSIADDSSAYLNPADIV
jgi:maltose alpha-D-glucosyltransferase/alpha-amylase